MPELREARFRCRKCGAVHIFRERENRPGFDVIYDPKEKEENENGEKKEQSEKRRDTVAEFFESIKKLDE